MSINETAGPLPPPFAGGRNGISDYRALPRSSRELVPPLFLPGDSLAGPPNQGCGSSSGRDSLAYMGDPRTDTLTSAYWEAPHATPPPTHYLRGSLAATLLSTPASEWERQELSHMLAGPEWAMCVRDVQRAMGNRSIVRLSGLGGVREYNEWVASLTMHFQAINVINSIAKARLATLAFESHAQH